MGYKYFISGSPTFFKTKKEVWVDGSNAFLDDQFYNSSSVRTIKEETYFASGSFVNVDARVNSVIDSETGEKRGDDFKILLFKSDHAEVGIGDKFYFDNNYWLVVNSNSSATIRRCNNVLRWTDPSGSSLSEHAIIDYKIASPKNQYRSDPLLPDGTIRLFCQLNSKTRTIQENQRFLFGSPGQWSCWRVYGAGINAFLNNETTNNTSARLAEFALGRNFINEELDNLSTGITDYYKYPLPSSSIVNNIRILPVSGSIIESETQSFSCYLISSGSPTGATFTFSVSGSSLAPVNRYVLTSIDGNNFSVQNVEKYLESPLIIQCVSGANSRTKEVYLMGAW